MKKLITAAQILVVLAVVSTLAYATEIRLLGNRDLSWGSGTWTSTGGATVYRINADILPFSQDNDVKVGTLYYFAAVATTGTAGQCLKADGDNTFSWAACVTSTVTTLPWDNITSRPTINSVTVTGAVLDNSSNYPTLNQNTTGTAAGLTAQYIDWNSGSGGASIANKPTLGELAALDNGAAIDIAGNAGTATALAANPSPCGAGEYVTDIAANGNLTCGTPAGSGTVTGPASATEDNVVTWGADNTAIKDSGYAFSALAKLASPTFTGTVTIPTPFTLGAVSVTATGDEMNYTVGVTSGIQIQLDDKAPLASPTFTGTVTVNTPNGIVSDNAALTGGTIDGMVIGGSTAANGTFAALVADNVTVAQGTTAGQLTLKEVAANGTEYRAIKAPDSLSDNVAFLLPSAPPVNGETLSFGTPADGVSTLTFVQRTVNWGTAIYAPVETMAVNFQWADAQYTIDNVSMAILDNTGKLVTAADNVTAQVFSCSALATPTCDNVINSTQVLGDAISYPAITTATAHLKDWMQVRITVVGRAATYLTFTVGVIAHATP